jgi:hypothetical protein
VISTANEQMKKSDRGKLTNTALASAIDILDQLRKVGQIVAAGIEEYII